MIHQWATKWLVTFNPSKPKLLLQSRKHNRLHHPEINMNQTPIAEVNSPTHLGINYFKRRIIVAEHLSELKSQT